MNFKKLYWAVVPVMTLLIASCAKNDLNMVDDRLTAEGNSTFSDLIWPVNTHVESGDKEYGYIGYGYDAMSVCDSTATRAKVVDIAQVPDYRLHKEGVFLFSDSLITATSKTELENKIAANDFYSPIRPLLKFSLANSPVSDQDIFAYYTISWRRYQSFIDQDSIQLRQFLTPQFVQDVNNLSPADVVAKYGTHLLVNIIVGEKFEVLYKGKTTSKNRTAAAEQGLQKRIKQFAGFSTIVTPEFIDDNSMKPNSDEVLIFSSVGKIPEGGKNLKLKGIIKATDRNIDHIKMDYDKWYASLSPKNNLFMGPNNRNFYPSIVPLYSLVIDPVKKQALKNYILQYLKL